MTLLTDSSIHKAETNSEAASLIRLSPMLPVNQILNHDCSRVLPDFPAASTDLVLTSPPYFQQRDYGEPGIGSEFNEDDYLRNLLDVFGECVRVTKDTGAIVINLGDKYIDGGLSLLPYKFAIEATRKFNLKLLNHLTWVKLNPTPRQDKRKLVQSAEPFFIFVKSSKYTFNQDAFLEHLDKPKTTPNVRAGSGIGKRYFELIESSDLTTDEKIHAKLELEKAIAEVRSGDLDGFRMKIRHVHAEPFGGQEGGRKIQLERHGFTIIRLHGQRMKKDVIESPVESIKGNPHRAVYPLYVVQQIIKLLTHEGDIVLDPFLGSGTTCLAAKLLNRNYIGIEINREYVSYAESRLAEVEGKRAKQLFV